MNKKCSSGRRLNITFIAVLILFAGTPLFAQVKTNLNIFYTLIDSSAGQAAASFPESERKAIIQLNLGTGYTLFRNKIISDLSSRRIKIIESDSAKNSNNLNYVLENAQVKYGEMFKKGVFGTFYVPRIISISGNFLLTPVSSRAADFNFCSIDTVAVNDIDDLENSSYPFTQGELPPEPFFASLFEPVVAIGTAALAVILFFTVRSK